MIRSYDKDIISWGAGPDSNIRSKIWKLNPPGGSIAPWTSGTCAESCCVLAWVMRMSTRVASELFIEMTKKTSRNLSMAGADLDPIDPNCTSLMPINQCHDKMLSCEYCSADPREANDAYLGASKNFAFQKYTLYESMTCRTNLVEI